MQKLRSTLKNMVLSLTLIAILMSVILGFVYIKTKNKIEKVQQEKDLAAIKFVLPPFNNDPLTDTLNRDNMIFYQAKNDESPVGCAVKVTSLKGYNGKITLIIGFLNDGTINNISVQEHKETPGLGANIKNSKFINQFTNFDLSNINISVNKDGGDINAITGATISSRAFCDAVQTAYSSFMKNICKKEVDNICSDSCKITNVSAIKSILPEFNNNPLNSPVIINGLEVFCCKKNGEIIGYAIKSYSKGYNSNIWILAGFLPDGTINKIMVLKQEETQGLGSELTSENFLKQFTKQHPDKFNIKVKYDGGDIDALSGATISSRAFCDAVQKAYKAFKSINNKN